MSEQEKARLAVLRGLDMIGRQEDPVLNQLVELMTVQFGTSISLIALVEESRQWFKAKHGIPFDEMPRAEGFCGVAIQQADPLIVLDASQDSRFRDLSLVSGPPHLRFYAGAPLVTKNGFRIGTACIASPTPRSAFSREEQQQLLGFARVASLHIELQFDKLYQHPVSGLPNRHSFSREVERRVADSGNGAKVAVYIIDVLSHRLYDSIFGIVGPAQADDLIRELALSLGRSGRPEEMLFQISARRFGIVTNAAEVTALAQTQQRILDALHDPVTIDGIEVCPDPTLGFAILPDHASGASGLVRAAVAGLRHAYKNRISAARFDFGQDALDRRAFEIATELRKVRLAGDQICFHLQPIIDLATGRCAAAEMLARWNHPRLGKISPVEFIPIAEKFGMIQWVTSKAIDNALSFASELKRSGENIRLSFKLSATDIGSVAFTERLIESIARSEIDASMLEVEITESAFIENGHIAQQNLIALKGVGLGIAVDDYGTAHSSLAYLRDFPVSKIKIDQTFIQGLDDKKVNEIIVQSTVALAKQMGLLICAEGVENPLTEENMKGLGVNYSQGFLHGMPMPFGEFLLWLKERSAA
jgi:predicted signal transduction protein with EAL and GGDEF domain